MSNPLPGQLELSLPGASRTPYVAGSTTSREAAAWQNRTGRAANLEAQVLELFAHFGAHGLTDEELDDAGDEWKLPFKRTLRPRRVSLWHKGFLDAAPGGRTRKTSTGRQAVVWVITPAGRGACERRRVTVWGGTLLVAVLASLTPTDSPVEAQGGVDAAIASAAAAHGVQEWRLRCLAARESSFSPGAYNAAGYHGLYQWDWPSWREVSPGAGYAGASPYEPWAAAHTTAWAIRQGQGRRWPPLRYCGGYLAW